MGNGTDTEEKEQEGQQDATAPAIPWDSLTFDSTPTADGQPAVTSDGNGAVTFNFEGLDFSRGGSSDAVDHWVGAISAHLRERPDVDDETRNAILKEVRGQLNAAPGDAEGIASAWGALGADGAFQPGGGFAAFIGDVTVEHQGSMAQLTRALVDYLNSPPISNQFDSDDEFSAVLEGFLGDVRSLPARERLDRLNAYTDTAALGPDPEGGRVVSPALVEDLRNLRIGLPPTLDRATPEERVRETADAFAKSGLLTHNEADALYDETISELFKDRSDEAKAANLHGLLGGGFLERVGDVLFDAQQDEFFRVFDSIVAKFKRFEQAADGHDSAVFGVLIEDLEDAGAAEWERFHAFYVQATNEAARRVLNGAVEPGNETRKAIEGFADSAASSYLLAQYAPILERATEGVIVGPNADSEFVSDGKDALSEARQHVTAVDAAVKANAKRRGRIDETLDGWTAQLEQAARDPNRPQRQRDHLQKAADALARKRRPLGDQFVEEGRGAVMTERQFLDQEIPFVLQQVVRSTPGESAVVMGDSDLTVAQLIANEYPEAGVQRFFGDLRLRLQNELAGLDPLSDRARNIQRGLDQLKRLEEEATADLLEAPPGAVSPETAAGLRAAGGLQRVAQDVLRERQGPRNLATPAATALARELQELETQFAQATAAGARGEVAELEQRIAAVRQQLEGLGPEARGNALDQEIATADTAALNAPGVVAQTQRDIQRLETELGSATIAGDQERLSRELADARAGLVEAERLQFTAEATQNQVRIRTGQEPFVAPPTITTAGGSEGIAGQFLGQAGGGPPLTVTGGIQQAEIERRQAFLESEDPEARETAARGRALGDRRQQLEDELFELEKDDPIKLRTLGQRAQALAEQQEANLAGSRLAEEERRKAEEDKRRATGGQTS